MGNSPEKKTLRGRPPFWRQMRWRLGGSFLGLTAIAILVSGFLQYRSQNEWLRQSLGSLLLNTARTGALLIDGELHRAVVRANRNDTQEYEAIRSQLRRIKETNSLADPVYTLFDVQGPEARFAVISHGREPVGKSYKLAPEIQPILKRALTDGKATYTDIYQNEHGAWITAFAPIRNAAGLPVAVLDVDFRADVYLDQLKAVRNRLYGHSLAGALLAMAAGLLLSKKITRPLAQLTALARGVVEGDLTARVQIRARDEIGMLANVLHLMVERLHVSHRSTIDVLVRALEARSGKQGSLSQLAATAGLFAERLEISAAQREALELGALLHDIGEIRLPDALLHKSEPFTPEEMSIVAQHPLWGAEIIETVPLLSPALDIVVSHHERYDGTGYPHGLRGEEIPLAGRIFAVADFLHERARGQPLSTALESLRKEAGKAFDPKLVEVALSVPPELWTETLCCDGGENEQMH